MKENEVVEKKYRIPTGKMRITPDIPQELYEMLMQEKKQHGRNVNWIVTAALKMYFEIPKDHQYE
jgi:hypothetical protein